MYNNTVFMITCSFLIIDESQKLKVLCTFVYQLATEATLISYNCLTGCTQQYTFEFVLHKMTTTN